MIWYSWVFTEKKYKSTDSNGYMHYCVCCSVVYNIQIMEVIQVPIDRWMDEDDVVCMFTVEC